MDDREEDLDLVGPGAETMVLLCRPDVVPFYTQLGWPRVSVPVAFRQPDGTRTLPVTAMTDDLVGLPHPTISVDLRGLPFWTGHQLPWRGFRRRGLTVLLFGLGRRVQRLGGRRTRGQ
ncbi:hypothetical protein [Streptomyces arenae]|uniref:hypothetical protein n=1 Tax=Streptomyces arenae TaxID=29301 RepID=UPI0026583411|nr:hypothetical protein [Streptomyces arenae]MCG7206714.1 hypothetical protein [Streptomyces arenae]